MTERRKITGENRNLYIWNEREDDYNSVRRRPARKEEKRTETRFTRIGLAAIVSLTLVVVLTLAVMKIHVAQLDKAIAEKRAENACVSDSIEACMSAIGDATAFHTIAQLAEEKEGMVASAGRGGVTVYVPNRNGATLTANAGGR